MNGSVYTLLNWKENYLNYLFEPFKNPVTCQNTLNTSFITEWQRGYLWAKGVVVSLCLYSKVCLCKVQSTQSKCIFTCTMYSMVENWGISSAGWFTSEMPPYDGGNCEEID